MARHAGGITSVGIVILVVALAGGAWACLDFTLHPRVESWVDLPDPHAVVVQGGFAYVADLERGLVVIRYTGVAFPEIAAELPLDGAPIELIRSGTTLYGIGGDPDLLVFDIGDPAQPAVVTTLDLPGDVAAADLVGRRLYLVGPESLTVLAVNEPAAPEIVGTLALPRDGYQIDVADGYAYVGTWSGEDLTIIDVANPLAMAVVAELDTPSTAHDVAVVDDLAFIADRMTGLVIADVSDPRAPQIIGSVATEENTCIRVCAPGGDYVYVGDGYAGLKIADVSVTTQPKFVGRVGTALWWEAQIAVDGDRLFVPVANNSLQIVDISSVTFQPQRDSYVGAGLGVEDIVIVGDRAFMAGRPSVWSVPIRPHLGGPHATVLDADVTAHKLDRDGDRLYVAADSRGVFIFDVATPETPRLLGEYGTSNAAYDVKGWGDKLFAVMHGGARDLKIFDIRDPAAPEAVASLPLPANATAVEIVGPYAIIAAGALLLVDVQDVSQPELIESMSFDADIKHLEQIDGYLFASSNGSDGVYVIDFADPERPVVMDRIPTPVASNGNLTVDPPFLYVARGAAGVQVLDIADSSAPQHLGFIDNVYQPFGTRGVAANGETVVMGNFLGAVYAQEAPCGSDLNVEPTLGASRSARTAQDKAFEGDGDGSASPGEGVALSAAPNPANPRVEFRLDLDRAQRVLLTVHDLAGRRLAVLQDGVLGSGDHMFSWEGRDGAGRAVPSGVYFARVQGERTTRTIKVNLVK